MPSLQAQQRLNHLQGALPRIDRADVEVLKNVVLVLPHSNQQRLIGSHLVYALAGFLDQSFREYDFRRGAADARSLVREVLNITYQVDRSDGELFYTPDHDPRFQPYPDTYETLRQIKSTRYPKENVSDVLEHHLSVRLRAVLRRFPLTGPWWLRILLSGFRLILAFALPRWVLKQLPDCW